MELEGKKVTANFANALKSPEQTGENSPVVAIDVNLKTEIPSPLTPDSKGGSTMRVNDCENEISVTKIQTASKEFSRTQTFRNVDSPK